MLRSRRHMARAARPRPDAAWQIALVHREEEEVEPLLYCISSDASKDEVSMITFPCTGRHGWMLGKRDGEPWVCEHAEEVRGLDRRIDLGGSEWVGKTSLMLVPVMERKEQDPQVMAIVMAASTKTVMHETHAMLMKAMAMAVRDQIRELLDGWKRDEKKIFKQSFVRSREFEVVASCSASSLAPSRSCLTASHHLLGLGFAHVAAGGGDERAVTSSRSD